MYNQSSLQIEPQEIAVCNACSKTYHITDILQYVVLLLKFFFCFLNAFAAIHKILAGNMQVS